MITDFIKKLPSSIASNYSDDLSSENKIFYNFTEMISTISTKLGFSASVMETKKDSRPYSISID